MASGAFRLRVAALISTGAVAVHELRYLTGDGATDPGAGHGYLPLAGLLSTVLLAVACAQLVAVVERARRRGAAEPPRPSGARPYHALRKPLRRGRSVPERSRHATASRRPRLLASWLFAFLALVLTFLSQELLEGLLAGGRAADLTGVFANGGWTALPLCAATGALISLALAGAHAAVAAAARQRRRPQRRRPSSGRVAPASGHRPWGAPLARHLAGRAPPSALT